MKSDNKQQRRTSGDQKAFIVNELKAAKEILEKRHLRHAAEAIGSEILLYEGSPLDGLDQDRLKLKFRAAYQEALNLKVIDFESVFLETAGNLSAPWHLEDGNVVVEEDSGTFRIFGHCWEPPPLGQYSYYWTDITFRAEDKEGEAHAALQLQHAEMNLHSHKVLRIDGQNVQFNTYWVELKYGWEVWSADSKKPVVSTVL